jgi:phospholipase C
MAQEEGPRDMAQAPSGAAIKTVFLILLENHSWNAIGGSADAPYINKTLLPMAARAANYTGPKSGNLHPSEPNYIWLEAGDNLGVTNDSDPVSNHQAVTDHLVTRLEAKNISWRSYQEDIADDGTCPLTGVGNYKPKHNPMVFFDDVIDWKNGAANPMAPRCVANVKPLTQLATDLQKGTVARYNFITPNQCNDMHSTCAPLNNEVKQGDDWLAEWVPKILASQAYKDGGALFITWDEAEGLSVDCPAGNCPIGMIVVSPYGKGKGYTNQIAYDHSSMLRTVQTIFGVTPWLRAAADATDLGDLFTQFP